ncbi:MAG TPA: DUF3467 domain-containing protein [Egibacteraceae bacterium]|nr:DUF3467 domain-containing protein [Egibacteraceae bacterium]
MSDGGESEQGGGKQIKIQVSDDLKHGVYANFLVVSHSPHEFTLDFCQMLPGTDPSTLQSDVVSRIKIAPTMVGKIIRALNTNMTAYEEKYGQITIRD